ncbi:MAG: hypothetical protein PVJ75_15345 [Chloroflexota bacterium]
MSQRHGNKKVMTTFCPACGADMHFRKLPRRGNTVTCRQCQSLLEVTRLAPLTLEWAFEEPFGDDDDYEDVYRGNRNRQDFEDFDLEPGDGDEDWDDDWEEEESEP